MLILELERPFITWSSVDISQGHASTGQRIAVFCPSNTTGRYVQIQIVAGNSNYMSPAEILVWGVHVYGK